MPYCIPQLSAFATHLCCFVYAPLSLFLNSLGFIGSTTAFLEFLHSLSISPSLNPFCPIHKSKRAFSRLTRVLSHSLTHYLNRHKARCGWHERSDQSCSSQGYMAWCGCHEILIPLCYPQEVFCPDQEKSPGNQNFHLDDRNNADRWLWHTNCRHKRINLDNQKILCGYTWMLVNWICLCFSLFLFTRMLTLVVIASSFKIEEFLPKIAISLKNCRVEQNNHSSLARWHDLPISGDHWLRLFAVLSVDPDISVSFPQCKT